MRIGIDARFLTHPQLGGFKTYTVNLIKGLSQVDSDNLYILYTDREPIDVTLPESDNFTYRVVPSKIPMVGMPFREQISLGRHIAMDKPDVVHFLCNTAPIRMPEKSVLSLLDVIQVKTPQNFSTTKGLENYRRWAITAYSKWTILKTAHKADKVITLSYYEKDEIVKHLTIAPERIHVTYFGVNPVFSQASSQDREAWRSEIHQNYSVRRRFILGVGYEPRKNIPLLIEAFARIATSYPDIDLVVVAAEKERMLYFQRLATELDLSDRIAILAALNPSDLAVLYNLADVFVFPSERESFGAPPLEALACGAATIAMNMTSLPEVLGDGAILIDGKDVQTWANAIEQVLTRKSLRDDLVNRGLERAKEFTWQRCAQETIKVYEAAFEEV